MPAEGSEVLLWFPNKAIFCHWSMSKHTKFYTMLLKIKVYFYFTVFGTSANAVFKEKACCLSAIKPFPVRYALFRLFVLMVRKSKVWQYKGAGHDSDPSTCREINLSRITSFSLICSRWSGTWANGSQSTPVKQKTFINYSVSPWPWKPQWYLTWNSDQSSAPADTEKVRSCSVSPRTW